MWRRSGEKRWVEEVEQLQPAILEGFQKHLEFVDANATATTTAKARSDVPKPLAEARRHFEDLRRRASRLPDPSEEIAAVNEDLGRSFALFVEGYDRYRESLASGGDLLDFEGFEQFEQGQRVLSSLGPRIRDIADSDFDLGRDEGPPSDEFVAKASAIREQTFAAQDADAAFVKTLSESENVRAYERPARTARREWSELRELVKREFPTPPEGPLGTALRKLDRVYALFISGYDDLLLGFRTAHEGLIRRGIAKHDRALDDLLETGKELTAAFAEGS